MSETLTIEALGASGDGIARRADGTVAFVPGGLPGEVYGADGRTLLSPASVERAVAPCRHFGVCGGCTAQHMGAALYAAWKQDLVATAFRQQGLTPAIDPLVSVPAQSRRRVTFAVQRVRETGKPTQTRLGFHARGAHTFVPIDECKVVSPKIAAALPALAQLAATLGGFDEDTRLHVADLTHGLDVVVQGTVKALDAETRRKVADRATDVGAARLTIGSDVIIERAPTTLTVSRGEVGVPPGAFFQAVEAAERAIAANVVEAVGKAKAVVDLFSGIGTLTLPLAAGAKVLAVDSEKTALTALAASARREPGLKPIETKLRDLFREPLSAKELETFGAAVLDPPRAGAKAQVEMLAKSTVPVVVMVSCNPSTMARDVGRLVDAGFTLDWLRPIDQFVWSDHVEAVAKLTRPARRRR